MPQFSNIRHTISYLIDADPGSSAEVFYIAPAPDALTVERVWMTSELAQNAGTAITLQLQNWGTDGTSVATAGTVHAVLGGTASGARLSARTPVAGTPTAAQNYFDKGDWMVLVYAEEGAGYISGDRWTFVVEYVYGKGNTTA